MKTVRVWFLNGIPALVTPSGLSGHDDGELLQEWASRKGVTIDPASLEMDTVDFLSVECLAGIEPRKLRNLEGK